ncbi:MAG: nucleotidyltransferase domain-containing protein [Thermodesulfovibrionales bacterium]|nr:nucleotidyltransferase domain-containing protein [Thermodesulfovibrionales bacterium]
MKTDMKLTLSSLEHQILDKLVDAIQRVMQDVVEIIVFGSRARGHSNENSDLDVAVVLDTESISKETWQQFWDLKWKVLDELDVEEFPLSLTLITRKDIFSRDFGLEKSLKTEGIRIWQRMN